MDDEAAKYLPTMKAAWKHVDQEWSNVGKDIAGKRGWSACHLKSVELAHPALPVLPSPPRIVPFTLGKLRATMLTPLRATLLTPL